MISNWPIVDANGVRKIAQALVLGLGSMFNHSTHEQNVVWQRDEDRLVITYQAFRNIAAGEELCISYGSHLTFKDADASFLPLPESEVDQLNQIAID